VVRSAFAEAERLHADLLVLLSDVQGIFEGDPRRSASRMLTEVREAGDLAGVRLGRGGSGVGTGGMASKVDAARIAAAAGIRAVVASADAVGDVLSGKPSGTSFAPAARRLPTRLLWLAYAATTRGRLHLDPGAVAAVVDRRLSLLPAGITGADGEFVAGDPVDLLDEKGHAVARGLVNFDVTELPALLGRSTPELARELGPAFSREVVHRDDIVLLR